MFLRAESVICWTARILERSCNGNTLVLLPMKLTQMYSTSMGPTGHCCWACYYGNFNILAAVGLMVLALVLQHLNARSFNSEEKNHKSYMPSPTNMETLES